MQIFWGVKEVYYGIVQVENESIDRCVRENFYALGAQDWGAKSLRLRTADYRLQNGGLKCRLSVKCGVQTKGTKMQTADYRLFN